MNLSGGWMLLAIAGLTLVSILTRTFFFISEREWPLPRWVGRGLQYAPVAALAAITVPDIFLPGGHWQLSWLDPRLWSALAAGAYYFWRRRSSMALPMAIIAGLIVFLPLQWLATRWKREQALKAGRTPSAPLQCAHLFWATS